MSCKTQSLLSQRIDTVLRKMMKPDLEPEARLELHGELETALENYREHLREHACPRQLLGRGTVDGAPASKTIK